MKPVESTMKEGQGYSTRGDTNQLDSHCDYHVNHRGGSCDYHVDHRGGSCDYPRKARDTLRGDRNQPDNTTMIMLNESTQ